jgi:hypothetical protein
MSILLGSLAILFAPGSLPQSAAPVDSFTVAIEVPSRGDTLRGFLRVAAGPGPHLTVVQLQGFPGAERPTLPATLQAAGFNAVGFMFRGNRQSSGHFTVEGTIDDAKAVIAFLRSDSAGRLWKVDPERIAVVGASSGTLATLTSTADDPRIVCSAAFVPFNWFRGTIAARTDSTVRSGFHMLVRQLTRASPPIIKEPTEGSFVDHTVANAERYDLVPVGGRLRGRKLMLIGAARDQTAPLATHYTPLVEAIRGAGGVLRDTVVDDSHNLPVAGTPATAALVRWLRSDCGRR